MLTDLFGVDARPVVVEVFPLRADGGRPAYRRCAGTLTRGDDPDSAARRLAGVRDERPLVHSTSWRCLDDGRLVLTYVVAPDPEPERPATLLGDADLAHGESIDRPSPARVDVDQVVAHAVRHLVFLAEHDPELLSRDPRLARALEGWTPGLAGRCPVA
ncbi:hypothetical protein [Spirillospora sp. CA-294931]|uniref:hypothetical protein n=1 Tax=Spirillospora sp. CA-294931 TaxID=3240042 RepID=UPI003D929EA2